MAEGFPELPFPKVKYVHTRNERPSLFSNCNPKKPHHTSRRPGADISSLLGFESEEEEDRALDFSEIMFPETPSSNIKNIHFPNMRPSPFIDRESEHPLAPPAAPEWFLPTASRKTYGAEIHPKHPNHRNIAPSPPHLASPPYLEQAKTFLPPYLTHQTRAQATAVTCAFCLNGPEFPLTRAEQQLVLKIFGCRHHIHTFHTSLNSIPNTDLYEPSIGRARPAPDLAPERIDVCKDRPDWYARHRMGYLEERESVKKHQKDGVLPFYSSKSPPSNKWKKGKVMCKILTKAVCWILIIYLTADTFCHVRNPLNYFTNGADVDESAAAVGRGDEGEHGKPSLLGDKRRGHREAR
ncbi:MAG: hypothetical protein Q9166_005900 [cf. Caloplaca sp. 2 TL-2023]